MIALRRFWLRRVLRRPLSFRVYGGTQTAQTARKPSEVYGYRVRLTESHTGLPGGPEGHLKPLAHHDTPEKGR